MNNRAQIGIGTLIVFIAMVMVAAITAGVLLKTTGTLQSKARSTGEEATKEVSTNVKIVDLTGYAYANETWNNGGPNITKLIILVTLAPGSSEIRYDDIILNYYSGDVYISGIRHNATITNDLSLAENSTNSSSGIANGVADFYVVPVFEQNHNNVLEKGEYVELHFWIEANNRAYPLEGNKEFTITILPVGGTMSEITRVSPSGIRSIFVRNWV
jgi:flagellin FlaB